jgi:triacylglycerol esterase/lipase EstA (alpha/beta hydrolase family)
MYRAGVLGVLVALVVAASAHAADYAPTDARGPRLDVSKATLKAALECQPDVRNARRQPVLLIPGTTLTPAAEYSWSWQPALDQLTIPYCDVVLPDSALGDIQIASEYVVYAIRQMHRMSGRRVDLLGHSQGGMIGRWALRFWPGLRERVNDVVGLAPSNHGTVDSQAICTASCPAAFWQQAANSRFTAALNSGAETFAPVDYTSVYTHLDEVVVPNSDETGSSSLHTGNGDIVNVALQDVCPANVSEHLAIGTYDPVAYALAVDALTHPGPADPSRLDPGVCSQTLMPGVDPATFVGNYANQAAFIAGAVAAADQVPAEPPLACYVTTSCK